MLIKLIEILKNNNINLANLGNHSKDHKDKSKNKINHLYKDSFNKMK